MSAEQTLRTTWAALLVISVSGHFEDEADRQELAQLAELIEHQTDPGALTPYQAGLALEILLLVFRDLQGGEPPSDGELAELLSIERLGVAYLTLADQVDRLADLHFDLTEACLASVTLSQFKISTLPVMTDELHVQRRDLTLLRDALEDLLHTGSPLALPEADEFLLRQSVVASLSLLGTHPGLVDRLEVTPDLRAALTRDRLDAAYQHLIGLRASVRAVA